MPSPVPRRHTTSLSLVTPGSASGIPLSTGFCWRSCHPDLLEKPVMAPLVITYRLVFASQQPLLCCAWHWCLTLVRTVWCLHAPAHGLIRAGQSCAGGEQNRKVALWVEGCLSRTVEHGPGESSHRKVPSSPTSEATGVTREVGAWGEQLLELWPVAAQRHPWVGSPPLTGSGRSRLSLCGQGQLGASTWRGQGVGAGSQHKAPSCTGSSLSCFSFICSFPRQNKIIFCTLTRLRKKRQ